MADASKQRATAHHHGLPDEIVIWEILVRLPPKSLLRCRAVCSAWRRATSARDFLLAHHARQPALPIVSGYRYGGDYYHRGIITFDHRAADAQLQHVIQLDVERFCRLEASCDGLLLLSCNTPDVSCLYIYNPATHQYATLPVLRDLFMVLGMYRHRPTGEYRVLLMYEKEIRPGPVVVWEHDTCCIFTLGSIQPPRNIGRPPKAEQVCSRGGVALMFRGSLHWHLKQHGTESNMIVVFDTTTESFKQMHAPVALRHAKLFEMDGVLGMFDRNDVGAIINIWELQDYENQVWTFKCKIKLPVNEIMVLCRNINSYWHAVVMPGDGELLVLVQYAEWLLQLDMDGKLVASFHQREVTPTQLQLKQTLVPHTFFPDGYVVNAVPQI
ncbi:F-box protein At5g49610-like [Aegilops tauschii subsp. strangulata]|uniref:F-box protein At5g49610-like n=1 Tax=Aegilops tauschii subsp. strangulata TaxID=200361 RepID=UPI003CC8C3A2